MAANYTVKKIKKSLHEAGVKFVRILWCDNANIIRGKAVHLEMLSHYFEHGVGISAGEQGIPVMYDAIAPDCGLAPVGEIRLVADWDSLAPLPYAPGHARVLGNMILDRQPWAFCPRHFLMEMIAAAKREGLEVKAAFENEFYLLRQTSEGIVPTESTVFAATQAMDINREVIDAIADALIAQKIPVEQYYPESGPGQQEISMRYTDALRAANYQIVFRETVRAIARQHNLTASFLPKIFPEAASSGCHIHLSLWRDGENIVPDAQGAAGLSPTARAFIAGILHHLPALMAITTPSPNSYRRIRPHTWSGAFRCWGIDNREAAVRVPSDPEFGNPTHFEVKTVDATANPFLALGAIIAAGLDGIQRNLELANPVNEDPGNLPSEQRTANGIDPLPTNLGEALENLRQNNVLLNALNPQLSQAFVAVRQAEWLAMKDWDLDAEVKLLLERY
ncbi:MULTISPECIES: glutamine synthetase family protein [unclassified Tolypothrix]|uniref:glutamine synthetase family protein n=1 Tax=unclassified Tolypothrix TaxID=2649714 RepID=UPI0005EAC6F2|nr:MULTISPECIES: glutamine synthetase family protein [unclassified Tolypothrix]BAY95433.1 L-glutamine synthetase [Microchaete diplosiphon NIES-3275]EKF00672.1 glutamine synthetase, catalytic domain protein [Tolypothrix sp. PCC 7601]MBE9088140.1 glutamine synthetase [Tolypothrix sp. LEGE 11397]UYD28661.1 glutamine synthetase [Tolypothrix sp. PCC 7712]UYD35425.1 glutamine synthetase [Tolypothrix sp. PCC 7601]